MEWWYLSFVDTAPEQDQWLGGAYVRACGFVRAIDEAWRLGINPGGEVKGLGPIPDETMDANTAIEDRERLLTEEELGESSKWLT